MFTKRLRVGLAVLGATLLSASAAQASMVDHDSVRLSAPYVEFGSTSNVYGMPLGSADLDWHYANGSYSADLFGEFFITHAYGLCARVRMEYFDDGKSLATKYGGEGCPFTGDPTGYVVDHLNPYASADVDMVKVSIEDRTASGDWTTVSSANFSPTMTDDKVRVTESGVDFGDDDFVLGAPLGHGSLAWGQSDGGYLTPHLTGYLHINNSAGLCARMNLRYYTESGAYLTEKPGGSVCAPDDGHHSYSVDLAPYKSNQIGKVTVQVQTEGRDGSWNVAGSSTVTPAE